MCCRCCSVTQQKVWVFGLGIMFFVSGLLTIILWPDFIRNEIYKSLPLSPHSKTYDKWAVPPLPIYNHMFLFNWTNAEQVRQSGVKPIFEQVGPYVFREVKIKEDITWNPNNTVTFYANRTWYFEPEMSGGTLEDLVTCPHLPSIAAAHAVRDEIRIVKFFFNRILNNNGGALYKTYTANQWLFEGFYDEFLDYAMSMNNSDTAHITSNHFAWFLDRNGSKTFEGTYTTHTGQGDLSQMGELKFWKGMNHTGYYEGECGRINGSTADLFVPNQAPGEVVTLFIPDTCRLINLEPVEDHVEVIEGIEGIRYETKPHTFDNGLLNEDMKCYCPKDKQESGNCAKLGATDLGPCSNGAQMFMSLPHFKDADESYAETIDGMNPVPVRDDFYMIMERSLGIPLEVHAAVMISLYVERDTDITILSNVPNFYAPLFITNSQAKMNSELAKEVKLALNLPMIGQAVGIALLSLGSVLIIIGIILTITRKWYNQSQKTNLLKKEEQQQQQEQPDVSRYM